MTDRLFDALQSGWFGELPTDLQDLLLSHGRQVEMRAGDPIFEIGERGRDIYSVLEGSVSVFAASNAGGLHFAHILGPGGWFGDHGLVLSAPRIVETRAAEDGQVLRVSADRLQLEDRNRADLWKWNARLNTLQTKLAISIVDDMMIRDPKRRMASLLLRLSGQRGCHPKTKPRMQIHASQQEISQALNLSLSGTGRLLRQMEKDGLISLQYGRLTIEDNDGLKRLID